MAKKRKNFKPIENVDSSVEVAEAPPKCYGGKAEYCRKDLCGKWFETCGPTKSE